MHAMRGLIPHTVDTLIDVHVLKSERGPRRSYNIVTPRRGRHWLYPYNDDVDAADITLDTLRVFVCRPVGRT
jgi:hypothetical protein